MLLGPPKTQVEQQTIFGHPSGKDRFGMDLGVWLIEPATMVGGTESK